MRVRWTQLALADFEHAHDHIEAEDPQAARRIAQRVWDAANRLRQYPRIGRVGVDETTREWRVQRTPYLLVYRVSADTLDILRVWHIRQDWRSTQD